MADDRETRAAIDTETVKGLLLINGGGAVALLTFLPGVLQKPEFDSLSRAIIYAVFVFQIGLASAVIHNYLRRKCSLEYAKNVRPCTLFGLTLREPCICNWSYWCMYLSIVAFIAAGVVVMVAALGAVGVRPATALTSAPTAVHSPAPSR
jgi:small-conductance mechanosensitive channel